MFETRHFPRQAGKMRFALGEQPWPTTGSKRDACCPRLSAKTDNMLVSLTRIAPNWPLALYSCALPATFYIAIKVMLLGCSGSATAPAARLDQSPDQVQGPISVRFAYLASGHLPGRQSTGRPGFAMPPVRKIRARIDGTHVARPAGVGSKKFSQAFRVRKFFRLLGSNWSYANLNEAAQWQAR